MFIRVFNNQQLHNLIYRVLAKNKQVAPKPFHRGIIPGGILFDCGWAMCGACPSIVLVQLGEGKLIALITVIGIISGIWIHNILKPRFFPFSVGACDS